MGDIPGNTVLALFDQITNAIKQTRPVTTNNKPLDNDYVYSQMILGMPIYAPDYLGQWTPALGAAGQQAQPGDAPAAPAAAPAASGGAPSAGPPGVPGDPSSSGAAITAPTPTDPKAARALNAAYNTANLCNVMLQVTADGSYTEYPVGRHLAFQYEGILAGLQPGPMPAISPDVQKQIDAAKKVLYVPDPDTPDDPTAIIKSPKYQRYVKNAQAYAQAKAAYVMAYTAAKTDRAQAEAWPVASATFRQAMDNAWDTLKTEGADEVERALDIIKSVGVPMQDHEIAKARQIYDRYSVDFTGLGVTLPWSQIMPSAWCDPNNDDEGWQKLTVNSSQTTSYNSSSFTRGSQGSWREDSSSTSGGGAVSIGFAAFGASGGSSNSGSQWQGSSQWQFSNRFGNTAKNLSISLEYMLCTIERPWLSSDLFYMNNYYCVGVDKLGISDGTVRNQLGNAKQLLPMIPQQFLVIRNVQISSTDWGSDGAILDSYYGSAQGSSSSSSSNVAGSGGVCLGFISFGGTASHSESHGQGQSSSGASRSSDSYFGTTFDGQTLSINGAQIIAFVSDIVPASPPLADPGLKAAASTPTVSGTTTASTAPTPATAGAHK